MAIDDVAVDFPDMPIILAHPSFPWQDEALSVATHKPQVYIDLSGWSPKYFPPQLVQYANTLLKDKILFGSDFPLITPERWMKDFAGIAIKDEVRPKIMKENAAALFGLRGTGTGRCPATWPSWTPTAPWSSTVAAAGSSTPAARRCTPRRSSRRC
jgi:uncharacterized protein